MTTSGLAAVERLLLLVPDDAQEIRDAGLRHFRHRQYGKALDRLHSNLAMEPAPGDAESMRDHVTTLRQRLAEVN